MYPVILFRSENEALKKYFTHAPTISYNNEKYFTHTTYRGKKFQVYVYTLSNNNTIMLPIVSQTEDVKGLGCSVNMKTNGMGYEITSNRWIRVWEGRKGKRTQKYNEYYNARQKKKKEYEELNKKA